MSITHTDSYTSSLENLRGETAERQRERATDQLDALAAKAEKRTCEQGCNGCDDCTDTDLEWDFSLKTQPDESRVLVPGAVIKVPIGELWNTAQITEQQALEIIEQAPLILLMMAALVAERNARPGVMTFMDYETDAERMVFNHWNGWKPKLTPETVVQLKAACEPFWANEETIALMASEAVTV